MFRLPQAEALINRFGFNNDGVDASSPTSRSRTWRAAGRSHRASQRRTSGGVLLGLNIGKNADTPIERATDDYLLCLRKAYAGRRLRHHQHLIAQHQNLRQLQGGRELDALLGAARRERARLAGRHSATCRCC